MDPRTQGATLGLAVALTAVLWLVLGGWQPWFPGLWFAALAIVALVGARPRRRRAPDPEA